jgi:hypothetical protein
MSGMDLLAASGSLSGGGAPLSMGAAATSDLARSSALSTRCPSPSSSRDMGVQVPRRVYAEVPQVFWARGYFATTVGRDEEMIRAYIRNEEIADRQLDQFELKISAPQNPINRPNIL